MSAEIYLDLAWLPAAPAGFAVSCRELVGGVSDTGSRLRALATHALDVNQLARLARCIESLRTAGTDLAPLTPLRMAVLSNATTDHLVPALVASGPRHGLDLHVTSAPYDQVMQQAVDAGSVIHQARPEVVLLAIDHRGLPLLPTPGDREAADEMVRRSVAYLRTVSAAIKTHGTSICIYQTLAQPPEALFGGLDRRLPGTLRWIIDAFNRELIDECARTDAPVLDIAALAETVGSATWHCPRQRNLAKFPFSEAAVPLYAEHVARLLGALRGKSRRCLILDLDNTLWGGVIGDDGIDGIALAQGDATGEAHLALQKLALDLRARGIVLAVSSKNTDAVARRPFREHPEMLLQEEHIAVFQANWNDKATNIRAIANELSLGLDAMVFVDDNPVERGLVRSLLPTVAVPEMPEDAAYFARTLSAAGYFEAVAYSTEDSRRADYYQDNARRVALSREAGGLEEYLASLGMQITFSPFDAAGRARISQLINKSNQYNLTTRRYTEAEVAAAQEDPCCFTLQVRLADAFGDNGMISVVVCREAAEATWDIDTWLMSCRVLGRRVEHMVLRELLHRAAARGIRSLTGRYLPTDRNALVADHYEKLGFSLIDHHADGCTFWRIDVASAQVPDAPMRVVHAGWSLAPENVQ